MNVVASWSGGKDSVYALYLAKLQGHEITHLLTMMTSEDKSNFHLIHSDILDAQAEAMDITLIKKQTSNETYEADFKRALAELKTQGVEGLVTGDICPVTGHEEGWLNRICNEMDLTSIKPLWLGDTKQIYIDYINAGFKATVVRVDPRKLDKEWLGRLLDKQFYDDLLKIGSIDPCGEGGEYHTVVTDGPCFKKKLELIETQKYNLDSNFSYLDVKKFTVKPKEGRVNS